MEHKLSHKEVIAVKSLLGHTVIFGVNVTLSMLNDELKWNMFIRLLANVKPMFLSS